MIVCRNHSDFRISMLPLCCITAEGFFRIQQSHGETWLTKRNYKPQGKKGSYNDLSESFCGYEVRRQRKRS